MAKERYFNKILSKIKEKKYIYIISMVTILFLLIGISYAIWNYNFEGNKSSISITDISLEFLEGNEVIEISDGLPMTNEEGKKQTREFVFSVTTKTTDPIFMNYNLVMEKLPLTEGNTSFEEKDINIYLTDYDTGEELLLTNIEDINSNYILHSNAHKHGKDNYQVQSKYRLKIWINERFDFTKLYNYEKDVPVPFEYKFKIGVKTDFTPNGTYTVKYNSNGGQGIMPDSEFIYNSENILEKNTFTREGHNFLGWNTVPTSTKASYKDGQIVRNLITDENGIANLYAIWEKKRYMVNVTATNGTVEGETSKIVEYQNNTTFNITSNTGYGNPTVTCTNNIKGSINGDVLTVENITDNTTCTVTSKANTYQIKYNANGGQGTMVNSSHTYGTAKNLTKNTFTKAGYTFLGWASTSDATTAIYTDEASIKDLTNKDGEIINLYAVWKINNYTVNVVATNGTVEGETSKIVEYQNNTTFNITSNTGYGNPTVTCTNNIKGSINGDVLTVENITDNTTCTVASKANTYQIKYNANGGQGTMVNSSHTYGTAKNLTKNTFTNAGYTFLGWANTSDATTAIYTDEASIKDLTNKDGEIINLYAVWGIQEYVITIVTNQIDLIDNNGSVAEATPIELETLTKQSSYQGNVTTTIKKPTELDKYNDPTVSCTNNQIASINGATLQISNITESAICTVRYKAKWVGITKGNYVTGATVKYGGQNWTVVNDNGDNISLALNGITGQGAYKDDIQSELNNAVVNNDAANGGLVAQTNGAFVTTNSGTQVGYTGASYWTDNTHFFNNSVRNHFKLVDDTYFTGFTDLRINKLNGNLQDQATLKPTITSNKYSTNVATASITEVGILTKTSENYSINGGTVTFNNTLYNSSNLSNYVSKYMLAVQMLNQGVGLNCTASNDRLCVIYDIFENVYDGTDYSLNFVSKTESDVTSQITINSCGTNTNDHNKQVVYSYSSTTQFKYGNQFTKVGWNGNNYNDKKAVSYNYSDASGYYTGVYTGRATSTNTNVTINKNNRTQSSFNLPNGGYCNTIKNYTLQNETETLNYRPFIIVREK